jgi:hypothetical protein
MIRWTAEDKDETHIVWWTLNWKVGWRQVQHWVADALVCVPRRHVEADDWMLCSDVGSNAGQWSMEAAYGVNQTGIDDARASEGLDDRQTASICFYGYALI